MKLITTDNPSLIEWHVLQAMEEGYDMVLSPFVFFGCFNQWMEKMPASLEYKLVSAHNPVSYETQVMNLSGQGYFLHRNPVEWDGAIYQWMARRVGFLVKVEPAAVKAEHWAGAIIEHSANFKMVESVQRLSYPFTVLPGASNG